MPELILPFEARKIELEGEDLLDAGLYPLLSKELKEVSRAYMFLLEYLHMLPVEEIGIPNYYEKLPRNLSDEKHPNIIYPVDGGTFTHIYPSPTGDRNVFISVEPTLTLNMDKVMPKIEERLLDYTKEFAHNVTDDEKTRSFIKALEEICEVKHDKALAVSARSGNLLDGGNQLVTPGTKGGDSKLALLKKKAIGLREILFAREAVEKIQLSQKEIDAIKYLIVREKVGVGLLEPLVHDFYVEDISCSGLGTIFIEHKIFKSVKTAISFANMDELDDFAMRLSERMKRPVTYTVRLWMPRYQMAPESISYMARMSPDGEPTSRFEEPWESPQVSWRFAGSGQ